MTRRDVLISQIGKAAAQLSDLREKVRFQEYHLRQLEDALEEADEKDTTSKSKCIPLDRPLPEQIVWVFRISGSGVALRVKEITAKLEEAGAETTSSKGLSPLVVAALSRRSDLFKRVGWGTYELK